jgi:hypothetical protein
MDGWMDG